MTQNHPELSKSRVENSLNRLGIDESNLRHLKWQFVTRVLKQAREWSRDIETVLSVSPDVALLMVRSQHESDALINSGSGSARSRVD